MGIILSDIDIVNKVYERRLLRDGEMPQNPNASVLFSYWAEKRGPRKLPAWKDLDLLDIWTITPCLIVKDVIDGGMDSRNRYWGTKIVQRSGIEATGRTHRDLYKDQPLGPQMDAYVEVVKLGQPNLVHRNSSFIAGRDYIVYSSLNLPLGPTDDVVDHLICVIDYEDN